MARPSDAPALALEAVEQSYRTGWSRRRVALAGVSLSVAPGERLGLVGPNGAGKSTCLRLAAGIERPRAGRVRVLGLDPRERAARARTGYAPEGFPFPAELSARAALALVAALAGLPRAARRAQVPALLERVGLAQAARERLGALSRGMRRRFALAQAFLGTPELLLLDEPTGGLDATGFAVLDGLLAEACARGASVVVASHVPALLAAHCGELVVLVGGRVRARAAAGALLARASDLSDLAALYGEPAGGRAPGEAS